MALALLAGIFALSTLMFSLPILAFAFRRSVGTGVMVLLVPCYVLYFAFSQFEHPRKATCVAGWLASLTLCAVWLGVFGAAVAGSVGP